MKMKRKEIILPWCFLSLIVLLLIQCTNQDTPSLNVPLEKENRIVLIGNNLCSRMLNFGHFETEIHLRYPDHQLFIRNMCDGGNTPGCLLYTSPSPRDATLSRMPSSA